MVEMVEMADMVEMAEMAEMEVLLGARSGTVAVGPTAEMTRRRLLERVGSGALGPGQRLGSERTLAVELGVSRATLRQALGALQHAGVLRRVPGRGGGTFITQADIVHTKIERDLSCVVGVPALLRSQGVKAGTRVLSAALAVADPTCTKELGLRRGSLVVRLLRVRLADGSPLSLELAQLPADRFPGLLELPLGGSVYELLEEHYATRPGEAVERIEVVAASADHAVVLDVEPAAPLLSIVRTTTDEDGLPIEHSCDLFRGDRTRIVVRSPGRGGITGAARAGRVVELLASGRLG